MSILPGSMESGKTNNRVCIVGAGFAGLSTAIYLVNAGYDVHIFEKNPSAGGKASQIRQNGFRFDTGPSLVTMDFVLKEVFTDNGISLSDFPPLQKLEEICRYFYPDGSVFHAYSDTQKFTDELETVFGEKAHRYRKYLEHTRQIYEFSKDLFLFNDFLEWDTFSANAKPDYLLNIHKLDFFRTMAGSLKSFFDQEKTRQFFGRYATYNGSTPYRAPATLNIISYVEHGLGGFFASHGIYSLVMAMEKAARDMGAHIHYNTGIVSIQKEKLNHFLNPRFRITGVQTDKEFVPCDHVISNADVHYTYQNLLKDNTSPAAKKYRKLEPSSSAVIFFWGMSREFPQMDTHNIFFSGNYREEFSALFDQFTLAEDLTVYVYISSKINKSDAPAGKENWFVMVNAPHNRKSIQWDELLPRVRRNILTKINDTIKNHPTHPVTENIENFIEWEKVIHPGHIETMTSSHGGSLYGISSNNRSAAFMRQPNRSRYYQNLYFCGGSAHPGGGIPLSILSGKITAKRLIRMNGKKP